MIKRLIRLFLLFVFLLFSLLNGNSQRLKLGVSIGSSLGTSKQLKKQMLTGETSIGYEINISENAALNISGALTKIKFDYFNVFGSQIYSQRNYLELSIALIKYFNTPRQANAMC